MVRRAEELVMPLVYKTDDRDNPGGEFDAKSEHYIPKNRMAGPFFVFKFVVDPCFSWIYVLHRRT